jgi:3-methyladenine DNA glycosylase/8-oxoguanine DNA glycosylase
LIFEREVRPRGTYSLALTATRSSDATRVWRDSALSAIVPPCEPATAFQRPDGAVVIRARSEAAVEALRFQLAVDDDHREFLRRFRDDPLIGEATRRLPGLRQIRVGTVTQALLRAFCGQLIEAKRARHLEARIIRALTPVYAESRLHAPPRAEVLGRVAPVELRRLGLHAGRAASLVRLCRSFDPERLHALPTETAALRLERERGLGPWSAGLVCLEGLGRVERGLVGDLGLIKLMSALRGRWVESWETAELLEPYGEWAGLASLYLLKGFSRGLVREAA